ncbi:MAG TPA: hypothetical protein PKA64_23290, partial [Myxococcota bacterium]|nr:hypothetical protein [Myxococcota bacterium]
LAAGAPGDTVGGDADAGSVVVVYGGPSGVDTSTWQKLQQDLLPPGDTIAEPGDAFGTAVVAARVDGDARDDLVVGAPYEDYTVSGVDQTDAGEIDVFWGDALGLSGSNYDRFRHASATVGGSRQHDHLGIALSAIDAWWLFTGTVFGQLDEAASCGGDPAFLTIPGGGIGDPSPSAVLNCEPDVCDAGYAAGDGELEPLPLRVIVIANAATVAAADLPTLPSATWAGVDPITGEALSGTDWAHAEVDLLNQQVRGDDGDPVCDGYDCVRFTFLSRRWWSTSMFGSPAGSVCPKLHALSDPYHNTLGESPLAFATDCDSTSCPISSGTTRYADLSAFAEAAVDECASLIDEEAMNLIIYDACRRGAGADGVVGTADDALDCAGERDGRARVNSHVPYAYVDYDRALQARQPSGSGFPWAAEDHEMGHALGLQHACDPAGHGGSTHTMQTGSCTDGLGDRSGGFSTTSRVDVLGATVVEVDEMVDMAVQHAQAWGCP